MRFSTSLLLAAVAAAAPKPAENGYWDVTYQTSSYANGYQSRNIYAKYYNQDLPEGKPIDVVCQWHYFPPATPVETSSCSDKTFTYSYDGENLTLGQKVTLGGKETEVSGSGPIDLKDLTGVGRSFYGETMIQASKAGAEEAESGEEFVPCDEESWEDCV